MRESRKKLLSPEKEGKYVFYGSPDIISALKPRQAYYRSEKTGNIKKGGKPDVFATPYAI